MLDETNKPKEVHRFKKGDTWVIPTLIYYEGDVGRTLQVVDVEYETNTIVFQRR